MVDIPEILNAFNSLSSTVWWALNRASVAAVCMLDARWGIVYCFVHLYLSLLFNLKLVDLCERGINGGLCGVLTRVLLRGGGRGS